MYGRYTLVLDIEPKNDLFFIDPCKIDGLKNFIIQDDKKIIQKILLGIENIIRTDNKIMLVKIKFSKKACKKLTKVEINNLSDTARDFILFKNLEISLKSTIL